MAASLAEKSLERRASVKIDLMGRPRKPKTHREVVLSLRVDEGLIKELDAVAATITAGTTLSRTQLVRMALREWLDMHAERPRK